MNCPRCHQATVKPAYQVCGWCMDEVIFDGDRKRLKGRGYDLTHTHTFALSLDPGVPVMPPPPPPLWDPAVE